MWWLGGIVGSFGSSWILAIEHNRQANDDSVLLSQCLTRDSIDQRARRVGKVCDDKIVEPAKKHGHRADAESWSSQSPIWYSTIIWLSKICSPPVTITPLIFRQTILIATVNSAKGAPAEFCKTYSNPLWGTIEERPRTCRWRIVAVRTLPWLTS